MLVPLWAAGQLATDAVENVLNTKLALGLALDRRSYKLFAMWYRQFAPGEKILTSADSG